MKNLHFLLILATVALAGGDSYGMGKKPDSESALSEYPEGKTASAKEETKEAVLEVEKPKPVKPSKPEEPEKEVKEEEKTETENTSVAGEDIEYGEYLAGECFACHSHEAHGIPVIDGIEKEYFLEAMSDYKDGWRENEVMQSVASSLGDEEMDALAVYFSSLPSNLDK